MRRCAINESLDHLPSKLIGCGSTCLYVASILSAYCQPRRTGAATSQYDLLKAIIVGLAIRSAITPRRFPLFA
jgi:hypothetical protein